MDDARYNLPHAFDKRKPCPQWNERARLPEDDARCMYFKSHHGMERQRLPCGESFLDSKLWHSPTRGTKSALCIRSSAESTRSTGEEYSMATSRYRRGRYGRTGTMASGFLGSRRGSDAVGPRWPGALPACMSLSTVPLKSYMHIPRSLRAKSLRSSARNLACRAFSWSIRPHI